jgi:hypothetical protein
MARKVGSTLVSLGTVSALAVSALMAPWLGGCEGAASGDPAVLNLEPRAGATAGEQPVRITGSNFRQDIGYSVYFGATRAPQVTIIDPNTLLVATPQHDPGRVDVVVSADSGPAFRIRDGFEFTEQGGNVMEQVGEGGGQGQGAERF